jgi:CxxC motif-containing protein (DUF1111 family)
MRPFLVAPLAALIVACEPPSVAGEAGTPLSGLSQADSARFATGLELFNKIFTPDEGLGPAFNANQCSACHTVPAAGGTTGLERVVKATRYEGPGNCDLLHDEGGQNVRILVTPALAAHGVVPESIPTRATEVGRFMPPFLFGLGLVEAIPEATIVRGADPDDADGDGISGRAPRGPDGRLLRFGWKADIATIEDFTHSALLLEMGITSRASDRDLVNGAPPPSGTDPVTEPEVDATTAEMFTAFTRFLAPPARPPARSSEHADTLAAGERLFHDIGCADCHTPTMRTGDSAIPALRRKTIHLYSDLLLHDMGPDLASVCATDASPREVRTAMLMGLQHRELFLHDGRASDLRDAILAHGGEAGPAREAFERLSWLWQEYLVMFLRSL